MRIGEAYQRALLRIQEIQTRIEQLRGAGGAVGGAVPTQNTGLVPPFGFPEGSTPPPGVQLVPVSGEGKPAAFPPAVARWESVAAPIAAKYGIETAWVLRIIEAESGGDPNAVSPKGAMGLMQLMPDTARALGVQNPFDPVQNIEGGVRYLRHLMDRFGDLRLALAAYNAGPGNVDRYGGVPPFPETQRYLRRILG